MTRMEQAQEALIDRQIAANGKPVTYTCGHATIEVMAWPGRQKQSRVPREPGAALITSDRDYFIRVADLVVDGTPVTPARGHRIAEVIAGQAVTFEVIPVTDEPASRFSDIPRLLHRIHTQRVKAV